MKQKIARILVEITVRKTLTELKQDPERSIRKLVDMALDFAKGRFQQQFFQTVEQLLSRRDCAYYLLAANLVQTVDSKRLLTFGMNVGYNGCTEGARTIRSIEAAEHFNIPWCLCLELAPDTFPANRRAYERLIHQGQELGIYTWQLHTPVIQKELLELFSSFPDCAFVLFCPSHAITPDLLGQVQNLPNLMFSCLYEKDSYTDCEKACKQLRESGFLYGLHLHYQAGDEQKVIQDSFLAPLMALSPAFTFFSPREDIPFAQRQQFYQVIKKLRLEQPYPTVFMELLQDNQAIDGIISSEGCSGGFTSDGQLYSLSGKIPLKDTNLFSQDLKTILKTAFPKKELPESQAD